MRARANPGDDVAPLDVLALMATHQWPSRRDVLGVLFHGTVGALVVRGQSAIAGQGPAQQTPLWHGYPRQDLKAVAEVVGASHFDEKRVRELVKGQPELVNAWWDWGFGDWESPLGAASHVGERGIAEFLIENGARIDIFAAAMLGQTKVVKAFVESKPGIQRTLGPHNITLLSHAEAGGPQAKEVAEYLKSLGDADNGPKAIELTLEEKQKYLGEYKSNANDLRMVCRLNRNQQIVADFFVATNQSTGRLLRCLGGQKFFPAGVPSVTFEFRLVGDKVSEVVIGGTTPSVTLVKA